MAAWLGRVSLGDAWYNMYSRLLRTKPVGSMAHSSDDLTELAEGSAVGLAKVLTTVDLVSLGVGSCVGTGMYVVAGLVANAMAGPGVILSFIIAAVASILSGKQKSLSILTNQAKDLEQSGHMCVFCVKVCATQSSVCGSPKRPVRRTPTVM